MGDVRRAADLFQRAEAAPAAAHQALLEALSDRDPLVRHLAMAQLAHHSPGDIPETAVREMLDTLLKESDGVQLDPSLAEEYAAATATEDDCHDLSQDIVLALARLPAGSADFAVPKLVALWQTDRQFYESALAAVALSFPEGGSPVPAGLREEQRSVLAALAGDNAIWRFCGDMAPLLATRGLPTTRTGLQAFLQPPSRR